MAQARATKAERRGRHRAQRRRRRAPHGRDRGQDRQARGAQRGRGGERRRAHPGGRARRQAGRSRASRRSTTRSSSSRRRCGPRRSKRARSSPCPRQRRDAGTGRRGQGEGDRWWLVALAAVLLAARGCFPYRSNRRATRTSGRACCRPRRWSTRARWAIDGQIKRGGCRRGRMCRATRGRRRAVSRTSRRGQVVAAVGVRDGGGRPG
jgi:hypothetical protein